jgi:LmbE family N-acetylglucosaminyl deacetylase
MVEQRTAMASESGISGRETIHSIEQRLLGARLLVLAPHMDDEALACGGTLSLHRDGNLVYCLFATDGSRSPVPLLPWTGSPDSDLTARRREEAVAAITDLRLPENNITFLDFPDGRLSAYSRLLEQQLNDVIARVRPEIVLAPFRFDVHPDHVALNRAIRRVLRSMVRPPALLEYFVYFRLRLLPGGDIRSCLPTDLLIEIDTSRAADDKRRALSRYETQTQVRHTWQERPILTPERIRERCETPEQFLYSDPKENLLSVFPRNRIRIFAAYLAEPAHRLAALAFDGCGPLDGCGASSEDRCLHRWSGASERRGRLHRAPGE